MNVPAQDPSCCWEDDVSSYRSGSCCVTSIEVSNDATATSSKSMAAAAIAFDTVTSVDSLVPSVSWSGRVAATTSFGDYVTTTGVPSESVSVGEGVKFRIASTFTPSSGKFSWAVLSESKGVVATGSAAQNTDVLYQVTESMKPRSTLLVYSPWDGTDADDTNVVACARSFEVSSPSALALPQNLTVSLSSAEVRPGATVSLEARATAAGSRVFSARVRYGCGDTGGRNGERTHEGPHRRRDFTAGIRHRKCFWWLFLLSPRRHRLELDRDGDQDEDVEMHSEWW